MIRLSFQGHCSSELKKHKLDVVAKHLGVSLEGHHRAVNDAEATAEIFLKLVDMLEENGVKMLTI